MYTYLKKLLSKFKLVYFFYEILNNLALKTDSICFSGGKLQNFERTLVEEEMSLYCFTRQRKGKRLQTYLIRLRKRIQFLKVF